MTRSMRVIQVTTRSRHFAESLSMYEARKLFFKVFHNVPFYEWIIKGLLSGTSYNIFLTSKYIVYDILYIENII